MCVSVMKGLGLTLQQKELRSKPLLRENHPRCILVITPFPLNLLSFFSSFDFAQKHPVTYSYSTLYKHTKKKIVIPVPAFEPCLPSLGKWKPYCVSFHNTVSTASASDWFTASLAQCRLTGWLDSCSVAEDQFSSNTQPHNLQMTHFR